MDTDVFAEVEELILALRRFRVDIEKGLSYGVRTHTFDQVAAMALSGKVDTYVLPNAVIIMELTECPSGRAYHVFLAAGDLDEILEAQNGLLLREASLRGASHLTLFGRRGWVKTLESHGWTSDLVIASKEVHDGQAIKKDEHTGD